MLIFILEVNEKRFMKSRTLTQSEAPCVGPFSGEADAIINTVTY